MAKYSKESYTAMFDQLLSQELFFDASAASECNIKRAMKKILGTSIRHGLLKRYDSLVLNENLDVYFSVVDAEGAEFSIILRYGA
jgi:hypothetical protein